MMDRIYICEALAKRNETDPFRKRIVTGDEKQVTYYNTVGKRSWSKCGEAAQTVVKPEEVLCSISGQCQATHFCSQSPEPLGAWLVNFNASTI
ncbi:hypothetical protein TNCV_4490801 [Trichonephila clavipes]|nr:hypothetical protein TNCV_4490801 [Trichonephila clavipes]